MAEATRLPVKTERKPVAAPAPSGSWSPFENLRREIDRVFDNMSFGGLRFPFGRQAFDMDISSPKETAWSLLPAVDVAEKNGSYEITAELPGMDEKNIEVKLSNNTLTIKGEKKEEKEEKDKDYFVSERRYGSFQRSFTVPEGIDTGKIEAHFSKGVLSIKLPKSAEAQKSEKKIAVKAA